MPMNILHPRRKGQTAIEYMLLVGVVVALVLVALKTNLSQTQSSANAYFNRVADSMVGRPNPCGDGYCCLPFETAELCPPDCDPSMTTVIAACPGAVCTNPFNPGNYSICPGSNTGLTVNEDWTLVPYGGCSAAKCQYQCSSGFMPSGSACVPAVCSGTASFTNATLCAGSETGLTVPTAWTLVPSCTGGKCEYQCLPGYYQLTSVDCVL